MAVKGKIIYAIFAALAVLAAFAPVAKADWPSDKPIEVVVGFAAGGETDIMARKLAPFIAKHLGGGATLIVVNKPGASGAIAYALIERAKPDGYTLGVVNVPPLTFVPMQREAGYNPANIELLGRVVADPTTLVTNKSSKYDTLQQVVAQLKRDPGSVSIGFNGVGTNGHLALLQLEQAAGIKVNAVAFKGTGESKIALAGGHVDLIFGSESLFPNPDKESVPVKVIAQFMEKRAPGLPNVPTAIEGGLKVVMPSERGFGIPKALPAERAARIEKALEAAVHDPEFVKSASMFATIIAWLPGKSWQRELARQEPALQALAKGMPKEN